MYIIIFFMGSVSLTIRIDEKDKKCIEKIAKMDDRSISYVVNKAIKEYIKRNALDQKVLQAENV